MHHAAARHIAAQPADALLHQRVAFHLFEFVADVLLAHLQILLVAPLLAEQVHRAEDHEDKRSLPQQRLDGAGHQTSRPSGTLRRGSER